MAAAIRLPCSVPSGRRLFFPTELTAKQTDTTCSWSGEHHKTRRVKQITSCRRNLGAGREQAVYKPAFPKQWSINSLPFWAGDGEEEPQPSLGSPSETVQKFYDCINNREWKKLNGFISDDCCFEDYSFIKSFQGKKEVMPFFQQLTECMGKNLKFVIERECKGDASTTVAIMWHLEWKKNQVPFTRGCSFYECTKQSKGFVIRHARVVIESPIKPGALVLTALKLVSFVFDEFPTVTEKFLQRPYFVLHFLLKIYNIFVEPFVRPVVMCYINLMKFLAGVLGNTLNILITSYSVHILGDFIAPVNCHFHHDPIPNPATRKLYRAQEQRWERRGFAECYNGLNLVINIRLFTFPEFIISLLLLD